MPCLALRCARIGLVSGILHCLKWLMILMEVANVVGIGLDVHCCSLVYAQVIPQF
jgi:hypothetical protein